MAESRLFASELALDPETFRRKPPLLAQDFLYDRVVKRSVFRVEIPPAALNPTLRPVCAANSLDGFAHHYRRFGSRGDRSLAGRGFDEIGSGEHGDHGGSVDQFRLGQGCPIEDHFQGDLVADLAGAFRFRYPSGRIRR